MLELKNVNNNIDFVCQVVGYQFPEEDTNWCLVRVEVRCNNDELFFEKVDPALTTMELVDMRDWFSCLANDRLPKHSKLTFLEPCLEFEFLSKHETGVRFAVHLSHEMRPNFLETIYFFFSQERLAQLVGEINKTLEKFPIRDMKNGKDFYAYMNRKEERNSNGNSIYQ